jgi:fermentation-respiration switch protein FrsA (DUF1100 family)
VYHPDAFMLANPSSLGRPFEDVQFMSEDGVKLHGWYFPASPGSKRASWAIVHCHGNGGNISYRLDSYQALLETGVAVFALDYRGYGQSDGRPGEAGTYKDAEAACRWLSSRGFPASRVIAYGESLGGGVASHLAATLTVGGLVLQSTFTSMTDIGSEIFPWLPVRTLGSIKYDTHSRLGKIGCPVLVMHSRADTLIRYHHAERNFQAAREPKLFWELHGDHNDFLEADPSRFKEGIERFLRLVEEKASAPKQ